MKRTRVAPLVPLLLMGCIPVTAPEEAPPASRAPAAAPTSAPAAAMPEAQPARTDFTLEGAFEQGGWVRGQVPSGTRHAALGTTPLTLDDNGRFFAAFDRDADRATRLSATLDDGTVISRSLTVAPRDWDIEHVDVARSGSMPSEAFLRIRRPELAAIQAARETETGSEGWRQDFVWPVTGRISGRFGSQRIYRGEPGSYHSGLDIATGESGTPFVAPADGVVVLAVRDFSLEGNLLIIDHGQGLNSAFLHASQILVAEGDRVRQGQHIGNIGASGRATGPHLHWSLKWRDARLDPLLFLGPMP